MSKLPMADEWTVPEWLDETGQRVWHETVTTLREALLLADADRDLVALYADQWSILLDARAELAKVGPVEISSKGSPYQSPLLGVRNQAADRILKIQVQLGMTPKSRSRMEIPAPEVEGILSWHSQPRGMSIHHPQHPDYQPRKPFLSQNKSS